jgi:hypothetical protein
MDGTQTSDSSFYAKPNLHKYRFPMLAILANHHTRPRTPKRYFLALVFLIWSLVYRDKGMYNKKSQ